MRQQQENIRVYSGFVLCDYAVELVILDSSVDTCRMQDYFSTGLRLVARAGPCGASATEANICAYSGFVLCDYAVELVILDSHRAAEVN